MCNEWYICRGCLWSKDYCVDKKKFDVNKNVLEVFWCVLFLINDK